MQVGPGGAAGGTDQGDRLAFLYGIADLHQHLLIVAVAGDVTVAVIDFDGAAVAEAFLGISDHTGGHRDDLRTGRAREVDAGMEGVAASERIGAITEVRGNPAL